MEGVPPQAPKESLVRGFKFVWRILLISNLALGAYIFTRPGRKDAARKDKKHTEVTELPSVPVDIPDLEKPAIIPSQEPDPEPAPESQWSKPFKW